MRAGKVDRVKRRLLREAVADNLDTIRGLPPVSLRGRSARARIWRRRASLLIVPLMLAGSTYFVAPSASPTAQRSLDPLLHFASSAVLSTRPVETHADAEPPQRVAASAFPLSVRRVALDAGHGGHDPGTSILSLTEKEITLDIGDRLRELLERDGYEVVVTRPDDRTIPLRERARLANESRSDIFVSIHVNSLAKFTESRGVETYYLGPTNDPSLTKLAASENTGSGYSLADLRRLLEGIYADARRDESMRLAASVQSQMFSGLRSADAGLENWGVKRAPFIVLVATEMPAVLAEVGCMSNESEAAMLGRPEYRQKIARALYAGIAAYASANDTPKKGS